MAQVFFEGKREEATRPGPDAFADEISLVGSVVRIKERLQAWRDTAVATLLVMGQSKDQLRQLAELVLG